MTPTPMPAAGNGAMAAHASRASTLPHMSDGQLFVNAVVQVARKEFMQHLRTKRLFIIGAVMVGFLFFLTMVVGPHIVSGTRDFTQGYISRENLVLAFYFAIGIIGGLQFTQLLGIVLTADAICSEWANRTIFLLLSKPVSRAAFVVGKFLGNLLTLAVTLVLLFTTAYLVLNATYAGSPTGAEVAGFFEMLGMIVLGCAAFAAISLFLSTLTKSTVTSLLLMLSLWLIAFPIIGNIGFFTQLGNDRIDFSSASVQNWYYFNPAADMQAGVKLLVANEQAQRTVEQIQHSNPFASAPDNVGLAALALVLFVVVFLAGALAVVQRRNFE